MTDVDPPKIETYMDYVFVKAELASIVMLGVTLLLYVNSGWALALVPCAVFHAVVYYRYKAFKREQHLTRLKTNQRNYLESLIGDSPK